MPDHVEFVKLVSKMRRLQKAYFAGRSADVLARCREIEKKIDKMLEDYKVERARLANWSRSAKSSELPGIYDAGEGGNDDDD